MKFSAENENYFKVGKITKFDGQGDFFLKKKQFHLLKTHFHQIWWTENLPDVAGCLVYAFLEKNIKSI